MTVKVRQRRREYWSPGIVVLAVVIAAFGAALVVLAVRIVAVDLVGASPTQSVGIARRAPVWLVWIGMAVAVLGGLNLLWDNASYLVRVARGRVPRLRGKRTTTRRRHT